ncbi:hypothetical protein TNCV_3304961 [Trichonephila clavipes]|nr:hypothetical protein TNCV_3304961 [Trichonephila clavipes]
MKRSTWLPIQHVRHIGNWGCQLGKLLVELAKDPFKVREEPKYYDSEFFKMYYKRSPPPTRKRSKSSRLRDFFQDCFRGCIRTR